MKEVYKPFFTRDWLEGTGRGGVEHLWNPKRIRFSVGNKPNNGFQELIFEKLKAKLTSLGCEAVDSLTESPELVMVFADGTLESTISPIETIGMLHKSDSHSSTGGLLLMVNTLPRLPTEIDFDDSRRQIVRKACHNGLVIEESPENERLTRAWWISTQGNYKVINASTEDIFDNLSLRIMARYGSELVNQRDDERSSKLTWDSWIASSVHEEIATVARRLGDAKIIEDFIDLGRYVESRKHRLAVLRALRTTELGEGMRSILLPNERVMAVTRTGGGKVKVSPEPKNGHLVPVSQITRNGYIVCQPEGAPIKWVNPSVETHENGLVYLAAALTQTGEVENFDEFVDWLDDQFASQEKIDILPKGLEPKVTSIDHFHRWPDLESLDPNRYEVVFPDSRRFPWIDFPCGSKEAAWALLSALFQSPTFRQPGSKEAPLKGKCIFALLPGHGTVAVYHGSREELTDAIIEARLTDPEWV